MTRPSSILIGVTADTSLILMRGFPEYLRDRGWDVHVASSPGPQLDRLAGVAGVTAHGVVMAREPSPLADLRALIAWVRLLRRVRPDVLTVGTPKAGLLGSLAGLLTRIPARVYVLRGLRLESSTGIARAVLSLMERLTSASAHVTVAVSRSLRDRFVDLRLAKKSKVHTIGRGSSNGVDLTAYQRENIDAASLAEAEDRTGARAGDPIVGFVGRLTEDKGLVVLAGAHRELQRRGVRHRMVIIGGIDDERLALTTFSESDDVVVTGHVDDPRPFYQFMNVLCLPTFREGFPNVVLEAAASGVPAVTTDATGAIDSVVDGVTGLIVRTGSERELADALERILGDPAAARAMGESARALAEEEYSRATVWARWHDFYAGLVEPGGPSLPSQSGERTTRRAP